jgi:hypothetical protein
MKPTAPERADGSRDLDEWGDLWCGFERGGPEDVPGFHAGELFDRNGILFKVKWVSDYRFFLAESPASSFARIGTPKLNACTPCTTHSFSTSMISAIVAPL